MASSVNVADNLMARKAVTQMRILRQAVNVMIALFTAGFALMSFDSVRQFGISLFASAGVAGIVAGLAARPLFENLIAGLQLAFTQPLRLGDAVVINNEFGYCRGDRLGLYRGQAVGLAPPDRAPCPISSPIPS